MIYIETDDDNAVSFSVPGEPKGKGRPRFVASTGHTYTPKDTALYENLVKLEYEAQTDAYRFEDGSQLVMEINAFYSIPKSKSKRDRIKMLSGEIRPTKKPDMDNVIKIIADSLNGVAYKDDSQIIEVLCRKYYAATPMVNVTIKGV